MHQEPVIRMVIENPQYLTQVILDSSVLANDCLIEIDDAMLLLLEKWSRNVCFELILNRKKSWVWPLESRLMKVGCILWMHGGLI